MTKRTVEELQDDQAKADLQAWIRHGRLGHRYKDEVARAHRIEAERARAHGEEEQP